MRMTYPIPSGPSFRAAQIGEAVEHLFLFQNCFVEDRRLTVCSSIAAAAASHHHEGSSLLYELLASISLRPRVPSWIWIRWIQYATHRNNFTSPPKLAMWTAMQNPLWRLATLPLGNIFWRHSRFSPKQPEPQTHGDYNRFCPQTANTTFATLWRTYLPQHIQQCLNLTVHFSLRHLAAKMLSQHFHNFISFFYFFLSNETCSINVNSLFHAAVKTFI